MRYYTTTNHDAQSTGLYLTESQILINEWDYYQHNCTTKGKIATKEDCIAEWCKRNRATEVKYLSE